MKRSRRSFLGAIPALIALPFVVPEKEEIITKEEGFVCTHADRESYLINTDYWRTF